MVAGELPALDDVEVGSLPPERLLEVVAEEDREALRRGLQSAPALFAGRTVWNVNSTAQGGGVAEMLQSLVPYARGAGIDTRWVVIQGEPEFFAVTKRIHNNLHGAPGDGGELDAGARAVYDEVTAVNAARLRERIAPGDIVLLHDPQTAGLVRPLIGACATVIWRCHVGVDRPNELVRRAWDFLRPDVSAADAVIFSTRTFVWDGLDEERVHIIAPSIDPFAPKNYDLDRDAVSGILAAAGIEDNEAPGGAKFRRADGDAATLTHRAAMVESSRVTPKTPLVVQVSRWDRLKDPFGVMRGFIDHVVPHVSSHLMLAGPATAEVTDDPEGARVFEELRATWEAQEPDCRSRIHLATLPMDDVEENAVIVNALQRRAQVVVQKSLAEGFGLTVAEAMWKARPVVASALGGICDQVEDGVSGLLVDPADLPAFGAAVSRLFRDHDAAERMGEQAQARVRHEFLGSRHLLQYLELMAALIAG
ncbi:MAG: glycosyltransferase [Candidatus Dormibacteraeota bacterium]|nr:glycosyltransferase [Candidatus Dormibacteraeota bacterium]